MALADYLVPYKYGPNRPTRKQPKKQRKRANKNPGTTNICFDCQKACGGCSWSAIDPKTEKPAFKPVPGWTAEKVSLIVGSWNNHKTIVETYYVKDCPEFVPDKQRYSHFGELSDEEFALLLSRWRRLGEI